jgi:TRAP-type uncharacterized transport system fused permease subunit
MLIDLGAWNIVAMVFMAWIFGWLAGAGLPPTATYIIGAVVIVRPMQELGINPWVAHFFVFLMSVWGELSPPTSLTAAVSARIANASFLKTMYEALKICAPITLMTFAIFTRSELVVNPGWAQIGDVVLVTVSTCGVTFAMFGRCLRNPAADVSARILIAIVSFVTMFHPNDTLVWGSAAVTLVALVWAVAQHRQIAPPKTPLAAPESAAPSIDELSPVLAEARRDIG